MTEKYKIEPMKAYLQKTLSEKRYRHCVSTAETALKIGEAIGLDKQKLEKLYVAGLLHDMSKEHTQEEQLKIIIDGGGITDEDDIKVPSVLHQLSGAYEAVKVFGVDEEIFNMIRFHCTGGPKLSDCETIIFLSDFVEPTRTNESCMALSREFFSEPITKNRVYEYAMRANQMTIEHLKRKNYQVHHLSAEMNRK